MSRKMFFNGENLYFAYALKDEEIDRVEENGDKLGVYRKDGTQMGFRVESYFGGNALNTEKYFGYVSGFNVKDARDQYFVNTGSPSKTAFPDGVRTIKKAFTSKEDGNKSALLIVQIVPLKALDVNICDFKPYGHFCVFTDKYKKGGWKGFGLWSKQNFTTYNFDRKIQKI